MNKWGILLVVVLLASLTVSVSAQDAEWELNQTLEVSTENLEFDFAYPDGWLTAQQELTTIINELESDHQQAFGDSFATRGYSISLRFQTVVELREKGITGASTLEDLLLVNSDTYGYQEPTEVSETTFLTWPALHVRTADAMGNEIIAIQGFYPDFRVNAFLVMVAAPSADALDVFLPTWDAMLDSVVIDKAQVNLVDYALYLECMGNGSPTVILEHGAGVTSSYWSQTYRSVAEFTRVCSHEREVSSIEVPRSSQDFADDLHELLMAAEVEVPYVLVGHSYGGFVIRVYADQYPDDVVGMVLVDSGHPDQDIREQALLLEHQILSQAEIDKLAQGWYRWLESIGIDWFASIDQVAATGSLGDMPLVVLTATFNTDIYPPEKAYLGLQLWDELQVDLASLSTNSTRIIIETTHMGIGNRPEVVDAIRQMVEEVRAQEE